MSVDAYDIIKLEHDRDGSYSQDFLADNCRQCRNNDGKYNHETCVDEFAVVGSDFAYLQNEDDSLYRTTDDNKCWNQETYDTWLKTNLTNPVTRQKLKLPVPDHIPDDLTAEKYKELQEIISTGRSAGSRSAGGLGSSDELRVPIARLVVGNSHGKRGRRVYKGA
jgi:hypothetical protein